MTTYVGSSELKQISRKSLTDLRRKARLLKKKLSNFFSSKTLSTVSWFGCVGVVSVVGIVGVAVGVVVGVGVDRSGDDVDDDDVVRRDPNFIFIFILRFNFKTFNFFSRNSKNKRKKELSPV